MIRKGFRSLASGSFLSAIALTIAIELLASAANANGLDLGRAALRGGTPTAAGALEAVVRVGGCTGTLVTRDAVLTAAHCVCGGSTCPAALAQCASRSSVTFTNVLRVGSTTRANVTIGADVLVHPSYCTSWLTNDYAILRLDRPADEVVQVAPMYVEAPTKKPAVGDPITLVGYGGTNVGATNNCSNPAVGTKRSGLTSLDQYLVYPDSRNGATLVFNDSAVGACPGDSGGPALNASGRVVGVASSGNSSSNSNYDATAVAWDWISRNACPDFDPSAPDASFCSNPLCPCVSAEGDCDADAQCAAGAECVKDVGVTAQLAASWDVCWDSLQVVTLYDGKSWSGAAQALPVGDWRVDNLSVVGNDRVSSVVVPPGLTARLCAENRGWGDCRNLTGVVSLDGSVIDNRTSNVEIFPGVTVYDLSGFRGAKQTFRAGTYGSAALTIVGNDRVSSLIASPGMNVRLCSENGAWGDCRQYWGDVSNVGSLLDQRTSSIEVRPGVTVYDKRDYGGTSQAFARGSHGASALTVIGNDRIRSLVVAPGMKARLCSENGAWGDCREFTGWVPYVGALLDRRTSHIEVSSR